MKLTEGWMAQFVTYKDDGNSLGKVETAHEADGVMFTCPKCASPMPDTPEGTHSGHVVLCWFQGKVPDTADPKPGRWTFTGSTLEDLSLFPSVFLSGEGCNWHGWVVEGHAT